MVSLHQNIFRKTFKNQKLIGTSNILLHQDTMEN